MAKEIPETFDWDGFQVRMKSNNQFRRELSGAGHSSYDTRSNLGYDVFVAGNLGKSSSEKCKDKRGS